MKIKNVFSAILLLAFALLFTTGHADDLTKDIFVSSAWVQAMPSLQKNTAAYMTITNNSQKEVVIVSASSDIAASSEIHQMSEMNGMMNMAMVSNIHVPAQGKVMLKPGGFHIMLINLKKPLKKDDMVPITLHFQDGSTLTVSAPIRMQPADDSSSIPAMKM